MPPPNDTEISAPLITLARPNVHEIEVKRSRFIAEARRADTPEEALDLIAQVSVPDATHNCWAYRIGGLYRFNDDGEPGGSAGRPILAAIEGQGMDHAVVVVTRWFGGTKLGVGGLVRAYGGAAAECLRTAERLEVVPRCRTRLKVPFDFIGVIYPVIERQGCLKLDETYLEDGLELLLELEVSAEESLTLAVRDATRGKGVLTRE